MNAKRLRLPGLFVALLLLMACAAPTQGGESATVAADAQAPMAHGNMAQTENAEASDLQFIDGMTAHHQGAVAMAEEALTQGEHDEIVALAEAVIAAQTTEIEQMANWRAAWYPGAAATPVEELPMGDMSISADSTLPFDQRFIEAMISHHEGAIAMAQAALEQSERDEIRTLAEAVVRDQQAEIEQMRGWLQEWYGEGN